MRETSKQGDSNETPVASFDIDGLTILHLSAERLSLRPGQCVSLTGPSGSGKSLFLRALADLLPHQGQIRLDGRDCQAMPAPEWRGQVMLLPPEPLWWAPRVADHFPGGELPTEPATLALPENVAERAPAGLSSGEGQRLALLRALARRPRVLLLDEPTANLDHDNALRVETLLREWLQHGGMAILVSHDDEQCRRLCQLHWQIRDNRVEAS